MTSSSNPDWKLSRSAAMRVLNPLPVPALCPHCQSGVAVANNEVVYGKPYGEWPWIYLCQNNKCRAYVGMHPRTKIPLGTLADAVTRNARKRAKLMFNELIGPGKMSRAEAYGWLARRLDITVAACHFGWFDVGTCNKVIDVLNTRNSAFVGRGAHPPSCNYHTGR